MNGVIYPGTRMVARLPKGSRFVITPDDRILVAGPGHAPYFQNLDGSQDPIHPFSNEKPNG